MSSAKRRPGKHHILTSQYEFFDKKFYQKYINNFYGLSGCDSPENLAVYLDIPMNDLSDAMQKKIIPQEWIYRLSFRILEKIEEFVSQTNIHREKDFSERYFDFINYTEPYLLERFKHYAESSFFAEDIYSSTEEELLDSYRLITRLIETMNGRIQYQ